MNRRPPDLALAGRPSTACSREKKMETFPDHSPCEPVEHPRVRGDCEGGPRPCPLVGCFFNNYLEVRHRDGLPPQIKLLHPGRLPEDVPPADSCSLDVADSGPHTLDHVAKILGLTRERIRQIVTHALVKVNKSVRQGNEEED